MHILNLEKVNWEYPEDTDYIHVSKREEELTIKIINSDGIDSWNTVGAEIDLNDEEVITLYSALEDYLLKKGVL